MDADKIEAVTDAIDGVSIANYNCPGQIVITGAKNAVEEASVKLKENGARSVLPLNVSGPFHFAILEDAGKELAQVLAERTRSQVVQVIGKKIVLYKEGKPDKKKIELP